MATIPQNNLADRPLRLPAWAGSVLLHALLLVVLFVLLRTPAPRGAAETTQREVGIVLRQESRESTLLEIATENPVDETNSEPIESTTDLSELLPEPTRESPFSELLAELTGPGPQMNDAPGTSDDSGGGTRPAIPIGQARTTVFGVEGTGSRFIYVFDRSISMRGAPLRAAKRELTASLAPLESTHQFQILFFNHRVDAFNLTGAQRRIAFATDETKRRADDFIAGVTADGNTDRFGALSRSLRLRPDVVFFLTDADTPMSPEEMSKIQQQNLRTGATICTIEFGKGRPPDKRNFLMELAEMTGGQYGYVDTSRLAR